jgi:quinol monooxygenase YgiN
MSTNTDRREFLTSAAMLTGVAMTGQFGFARQVSAMEESVTQLASFRINPEKEAEAISQLNELTSAVEALEPGVLAYIAHRSASDPNLLTFFEIYENEAALKNHGQQPHLAKMGQAFAENIFLPFSSEVPVKVDKLDKVSGFAR